MPESMHMKGSMCGQVCRNYWAVLGWDFWVLVLLGVLVSLAAQKRQQKVTGFAGVVGGEIHQPPVINQQAPNTPQTKMRGEEHMSWHGAGSRAWAWRNDGL